MDDSKEKLLQYVSSLPTGPLEKTNTLISLLKPAWDSLSGSSIHGTTEQKLDRMEKVYWRPPLLEFILERHGGTVNGSSRAALHHWQVNINNWNATICKEGYREIHKKKPKYDASNDAEAIARLLLNSQYTDSRLKIKLDGRIQVLIDIIIPDTGAKSTTATRRRAFRSKLSALLMPHGWIEGKAHLWKPPEHTHPL